jgi:hypothetical protein
MAATVLVVEDDRLNSSASAPVACLDENRNLICKVLRNEGHQVTLRTALRSCDYRFHDAKDERT